MERYGRRRSLEPKSFDEIRGEIVSKNARVVEGLHEKCVDVKKNFDHENDERITAIREQLPQWKAATSERLTAVKQELGKKRADHYQLERRITRSALDVRAARSTLAGFGASFASLQQNNRWNEKFLEDFYAQIAQKEECAIRIQTKLAQEPSSATSESLAKLLDAHAKGELRREAQLTILKAYLRSVVDRLKHKLQTYEDIEETLTGTVTRLRYEVSIRQRHNSGDIAEGEKEAHQLSRVCRELELRHTMLELVFKEGEKMGRLTADLPIRDGAGMSEGADDEEVEAKRDGLKAAAGSIDCGDGGGNGERGKGPESDAKADAHCDSVSKPADEMNPGLADRTSGVEGNGTCLSKNAVGASDADLDAEAPQQREPITDDIDDEDDDEHTERKACGDLNSDDINETRIDVDSNLFQDAQSFLEFLYAKPAIEEDCSDDFGGAVGEDESDYIHPYDLATMQDPPAPPQLSMDVDGQQGEVEGECNGIITLYSRGSIKVSGSQSQAKMREGVNVHAAEGAGGAGGQGGDFFDLRMQRLYKQYKKDLRRKRKEERAAERERQRQQRVREAAAKEAQCRGGWEEGGRVSSAALAAGYSVHAAEYHSALLIERLQRQAREKRLRDRAEEEERKASENAERIKRECLIGASYGRCYMPHVGAYDRYTFSMNVM
jgi:hypothetical protein